jgi:glutathione S-transferase
MRYELYYWPSIQGRGEFVRLALEEAQADYVDIARRSGKGLGVPAMNRYLGGAKIPSPPFAPPFLKAGKLVIGQTANILSYLGPRHGLAPKNDAGRFWVNQVQLTISDFVAEIHDTHHPIVNSLYYHQQKPEAKRRSRHFTAERMPKFLGYFEKALAGQGRKHPFIAGRLSYADLSLFQVVAGLLYAFPRTLARQSGDYPLLMGLHERIALRPNIAAYLASKRRIPFNQYGIFRHYPELDR